MIGQNVGNYRITTLIAEGGMGAVYLAEHPGLGRRAAVKVLDPGLARDRSMIDRFFNEARAANAIGHRGIVEVWDFGMLPGGAAYIAMEHLTGETLAARLKRVGRLAVPEAVDVADQVAAALGAAHAKGIIHRDLKPDNVFLTPDSDAGARAGTRQRVKVLDFGIAKLAERPAHFDDVRTRTGALMGTPTYMSPEQCRDASDVDHRTDVYSLGVVLYQMLAGAPPFSSSSWGELVHMHLGTLPPPPRARAPEIPQLLEQIVLKSLEKDPAARFQSMAHLQDALRGRPSRTLLLSDRPHDQTRAPGTAPLDAEPCAGATLRLDVSGAPADTAVAHTTIGGAAGAIERETPSAAWRRRAASRPVAAALAAGALALGVLVVALWGGPSAKHPPARERALEAPAAVSVEPTSAPAVLVPASATAAPSPPTNSTLPADTITIELVTDPDGADVVRARDGARLGSTPLTLSWPRAPGSEALRLERRGYRSERVAAPTDRDFTARLNLERMPARGTSEAGAGKAAEKTADERRPPSHAGKAMPRTTPKPTAPAPMAPRNVSPKPGGAVRREPLKI